jgi:hypothetical protein
MVTQMDECKLGGLIPVRAGQLWGYQDAVGSWIIPPRYAAATCFNKDQAFVPVIERQQWCPINKFGTLVRPESCSVHSRLVATPPADNLDTHDLAAPPSFAEGLGLV